MSEIPKSVDGVTSPPVPTEQKVPPPVPTSPAVKRWKRIFITLGILVYTVFAGFAFLLMLLLPNVDGMYTELIPVGVGISALAGVFFLFIGIIAAMRIVESKAHVHQREFAAIKVIIAVLPGLVLSVLVPIMISREPPIIVDIVKPVAGVELVAPVTMTFSLERSVKALERIGLRSIKYQWDLESDGKVNDETVTPFITTTYDRVGIYPVSVAIVMVDGSRRTGNRSIIIRKSVFSVTPSPAIVNEPALFSVAHLVTDPKLVEEVRWDYDADGKPDEAGKQLHGTYTFYRTGSFPVMATVRLVNKTEVTFERLVEVVEPAPLPFPVKVVTEPKHLVGPPDPPFGVLFHVETDEPLQQISWVFGDGTKAEGERVAHAFNKKGNYLVSTKVRSASGELAELTTLVQILEALELPDLVFEGLSVAQGGQIEGEVPLTVNIRPVTRIPFVEFVWDAPDATELGSTQGELQAIYRKEGTYKLSMIAKDIESRVFRRSFTVLAKPPSSSLSIFMQPEAGNAPLDVRFDASDSLIPGETITGFEWDFGDDSPPDFGGAVARHTFLQAGTFIVRLNVRTTSGRQFTTTKTLLVRAPILKSCFTPSRTSGVAPMGVSFLTECITGTPAVYQWDFGDGATSTLSSPIHTFTVPGEYTVTLTISDATGKSSKYSVRISARES
jgi:PKD repeat protein